MANNTREQVWLHIGLPSDLMDDIERAAELLGQSVADYAASTLAREAARALLNDETTVLSPRDRDVFLSLVNDAGATPNRALTVAANRYRWRRGE